MNFMTKLRLLKSTNSLKLFYPLTSPFKKAKKIFIYGVYGAGNLGDEAILKCILSQLETLSEYQTIILSKKPDLIYKDYKKTSVHPYIFKKAQFFLNSRSFSSILILGGGGILKDYENTPTALKNFMEIPMIALKNKYKTMLYSAGVENIIFNESRDILKRILNQFDILTVRDPYSKERLKKLGVQKQIYVTGDPAVLLLSNMKGKRNFDIDHPLIVVSLRNWFEKGYFQTNEKSFNNFLSVLAYSLDIIVEKFNAKILFLPFRTVPFDNDKDVMNYVASKMNHKQNIFILQKVPTFDQLKSIYAQTVLTIGMRLHSLIFSFSSLTPMIAISYSKKIIDFMNYINMNDFTLTIDNFSTKSFLNLTEEIFDNFEKLQHSIFINRNEYLNRLDKNYKLLQSLL